MRHSSAALAVLAVAGLSGPALAQQSFPNARPVWESASGGAVAARAPGRMVRAGIARAAQAHRATIGRTLAGPTITATQPQTDPASQLRADLIATIFADLNSLLIQIIAQQALAPPPPTSPNGGTSPPATDVSNLLGTINGPGTS